jgi:hypothetical protein
MGDVLGGRARDRGAALGSLVIAREAQTSYATLLSVTARTAAAIALRIE